MANNTPIRFRISYRHYQILQLLHREPALVLGDIEAALGITKSYTSRLIKDLVDYGYLTPPSRIVTPRGRRRLAKPPPRLHAPHEPALLP